MYVDDDYESFFPAGIIQTYSVTVRFACACDGALTFERNLTAAVRGGADHEAVGELPFVNHGLNLQAGDTVRMTAVESRWSQSPGPNRNAEDWPTIGGQVDGLSLCRGAE